MKQLHHAAALALLGWYLLVPPFDLDKAVVDDAAPLSRWTIKDSFSSVDECRAQIWQNYRLDYKIAKTAEGLWQEDVEKQRKLVEKGDPAAKRWLEDSAKADPHRVLRYTGTVAPHDPDWVLGVCIATDDPRLRGR